MKFSGRTDSRGARLLKRPYGARGGHSPLASYVALMVAVLLGVLLLIVAAFRHVLGAPESAGFVPILLTPLIVAARLAGEYRPESAWLLALGALVLGTLWRFVAPFLNRRAPDAILLALIAFQLFWLAYWGNSLLPRAGLPSWSILSLPQQLNMVFGVLLLLALIAAWILRPATGTSYDRSAPSRITGFLKKRRLRSRLGGAALMLLAAIIIFTVALIAFVDTSTPGAASSGISAAPQDAPVSGPMALMIFLVADVIYAVGRKLWQRLP